MELEFSHDTTRTFVEALHELEGSGDTDPMAALFTDDAPVQSIDGHPGRRGADGIADLFTTYRKQFDTLSTTFTAVTEDEHRAALEWETEATGIDGRDIHYRGVTVIDVDGASITRFSTIYDSAALLQRPAVDGAPARRSTAAPEARSTASPTGTSGDDSTGGDVRTAGHTGADSGLLDEADRAASDGDTP